MLNLPKRKSTFNFYESFSDLVFCALVMFLVLVLFLAMSVNQKSEQVEVDLKEVKQTRQLAEQEAELAKEEAEQLRAQAKAEAELAKQELKKQQELRIALLSQRDTELAKIEKERQAIIEDAQKLVAMERTRVDEERKKMEAARQKAEAEIQKQREIMMAARAKADAEIDKQREQIAAARAKVDAEIQKQREAMAAAQAKAEAEFDTQRSALKKMETDLERQRRLYEKALGANRYAGLPGAPRLVVAYDWQPNRISIYPVPDWMVEALNTTPPGLDGEALSAYYAQQRNVFLQLAKQVDPMTPRQYRALMRAISVGREPIPLAGSDRSVELDLVFVQDKQGKLTNEVGFVIPDGNGERAGVKVGDVLIALGEDPITPASLQGLLSKFKPGDTARLLLRRAGRPVTAKVSFDTMQKVELIDAYRTDLSMVVSGALDTDYTYLWAPAKADALRAQLQAGKANDAVWQGESRWVDRETNVGRPVLRFDAQPGGAGVIVGGEKFSMDQFRRVLEAIGGGGIVIEYEPKQGPRELPETIYEQALRPTGFVIRAPQLDKILRDGQ